MVNRLGSESQIVECPNHTKDVSVQTEIESELLELRNENAKLRKELEEAKNKIKIIEQVKNDAVRFDIKRFCYFILFSKPFFHSLTWLHVRIQAFFDCFSG